MKKISFKISLCLLIGVLFQLTYALCVDLGNQGDTLPFARQFTNPDWISNDWYLNLKIGYRNLFNYLFGPLYNLFGFRVTILFGELIIAPSFVVIIYYYFKNFKIDLLLLPLFVALCTLMPSLFANEWIVGDVDTKVFSYLFALGAILSFSNNKVKVGLILLGISSSFHVLIGIYSSIAAVLAYFYSQKAYLDLSVIRGVVKNFYLYLIFAANALFFSYEWLSNISIDPKKTEIINELLVRTRLSHHLWPYNISWTEFGFKLLFFSLLGFISFRYLKKEQREFYTAIFVVLLLSMCLAGSFGLLNQNSLMKFYLFRIPDTLIPFFGILGGVKLLNNLVVNFNQKKIVQFVLAFITLGLFGMITWSRLPVSDISSATISNKKLHLWIKENTEKNSSFLIPPKWKYFYLFAERAQFITYKHLPQNNKDVWQWIQRLEALGCDLSKVKGSRALKNNLKKCYKRIDLKTVQDIKEKYGITYFVSKQNFDSSFERIFEDKGYKIYKL